MEKTEFTRPEMEIIYFEAEDIITSSSYDPNEIPFVPDGNNG